MLQLSKPNRMVIGLVGGAASGKDSLADAFVCHGFTHISSSDCVRAEIEKRGLKISREQQTLIADELRLKKGPAYWVEQSLLNTDSRDNVIVSGLYAVGEGEFIRESLGGMIVGVVASLDTEQDAIIRFNRLKLRADGDRDDLCLEGFKEAASRESSGVDDTQANIRALIEMADLVVVNDGTLKDLSLHAEHILTKLGVCS